MARRFRDAATGRLLDEGVEEVFFCDECGEEREKGDLLDLSIRGTHYGWFCPTCLVEEDVIQSEVTEDGEVVTVINDAEGKELTFRLWTGSEPHV